MRPIIDPRRRRHGGRRVEPEAEVASGDRRQPARRDQPDETPRRVDGLDRAAGGDARPRAAGCDGVGRRRLRLVVELTGIGAALVLLAVVACGLDRLAPLVSRGGSEFLGAQRAWRSAGIRFVPRGDPSSHGTSFRRRPADAELARMRAASCAGAGILLVASRRWSRSSSGRRRGGSVRPPISPRRICLIVPTLANAVVIMSAYLASASLVWGFADASTGPAARSCSVRRRAAGGQVWRVAHLSDIHIVGERYGFRIESGRGGPRGNERLMRVMARLEGSMPPGRSTSFSSGRHDRRRALGRMGRVLRHGGAAIPVSPSGCSSCPAITTSISLIAPIPRVSICRSARQRRLRKMRALSAIAAVRGDRLRLLAGARSLASR